MPLALDPRGSAEHPWLPGKAGAPSLKVSGLSWMWLGSASPLLLPGHPRAELPLLLHPGTAQGEHETPRLLERGVGPSGLPGPADP